MSTTTRLAVPFRTALLLAALTGAATQPSAHAGPLPEFTGYTRIGYPSDDAKKDDPAVAEALRNARPIGVTIYYMVLDQQGGDRRGTEFDRWGTGIPNFDKTFTSGLNNDRASIDPDARYLYLYQVVNDSGREAAVKNVSIRLIVEPRLITSWGHFAERKPTDKGTTAVRGVGFTIPVKAKGKGDPTIRPVSTAFPGVSDRRYLSPAPAIRAPRTYGLGPIALGTTLPVAEGDDVGKESDAVLIVPNADLSGLDRGAYLKPSVLSDAGFAGMDDPKARERMRQLWRTRWPAVRAFWNTDTIKPRQRSTIFGFTSDHPPTLAEATVAGRALGVGMAKDGVEGVKGAAALSVDENGGPIERRYPGDRTLPDYDLRVAGASYYDAFSRGTLPRTTAGITGAADIGPAGFGPGGIVPVSADGPIGTLPTPFVRPVAAEGPVGGSAPVSSGGLGAATGGLGGLPLAGFGGIGGGTPGMPGAFFPARSAGGGGGFGGGSGAGTDSGTDQGQGTDQNQNQLQPITITNTVTVDVNQSQNQNQNQQQQQQQKQQQGQQQGQNCCPDGNVVPAPPAWMLGLLGLPAFVLFSRRRPRPEGAGEPAPPAGEPTA